LVWGPANLAKCRNPRHKMPHHRRQMGPKNSNLNWIFTFWDCPIKFVPDSMDLIHYK
jgi:hypothetical protein